jgi:hypothetical protein
MAEKIILEIINPEINTEQKIATVLEVFAKATGASIEIEHAHDDSPSEPTPYPCLREQADDIFKPVQKKLWQLYSYILEKWLRSDLEKAEGDRFKLNGRIFINPKTGAYLTMKEWTAIQKDLTRVFTWLYGKSQEAIVKQAMAMGKVLQSMEPDARLDAVKNDIPLDEAMRGLDSDAQFKHLLDFANVHTGELIQDVTERSRKAIVRVIMQGYQDRLSTSDLEDRLFDQFSTLNRDWRRIAETETAINFNNGFIAAEIKENSKSGKPVFMMGVSGAGACSFCATEINNRIVVALDGPPATGGDSVVVDGKTYTAIWPGKNNFGRKRAQWWVSPNVHPHCRCSWIRMPDVNDDYISRLRAAMAT